MTSPERIGVSEILNAAEDGVLTENEILDAVRSTLKQRKTEIGALLATLDTLIEPQLPKVVTFADFRSLDALFRPASVTRAWHSILGHSLRNPNGVLAGVAVEDESSIGYPKLDLRVFAESRSLNFHGEYIANYGARSDEIFELAVRRAGIDVGDWPKLLNF